MKQRNLGRFLVSTQKIIIFFFSIFAGKTSQMLTCLILFLQEKPHKCSMCSKSFPTPGDLKSHTYVHTGTWPFKCHICHRGFSKQTNLKNHLLLHSGNFLKTAVIDNMTAVRWWLSFKPPLHPSNHSPRLTLFMKTMKIVLLSCNNWTNFIHFNNF